MGIEGQEEGQEEGVCSLGRLVDRRRLLLVG